MTSLVLPALTSSATMAVGAFSLVQMLLLSACVVLVIAWLGRCGAVKAMVVAVVVFLRVCMLVASRISSELRCLLALHMLVPFLLCALSRKVSGAVEEGVPSEL